MTARQALRQRFASGVAWNAVCTIALQGGTFLTNLAVANLLGASQYGRFGFVVSTAQTLGSVLQLAAGLAASKFIAEHHRTRPAIAAAVLAYTQRLSIATGTVGSLGLAAFALSGAGASTTLQGLQVPLAIAAPIVFCSVLTGLQTSALAGLEGFAATARVVGPLMLLQVLSTTLAAEAFGLSGALVAMSANFGLRAFFMGLVVRREAHAAGIVGTPTDPVNVRRMVLGFILPSAVSGFTYLPALWLATWALAGTADGFAEVGRLNAALAVRGALMILPSVVNAVGFSLLNAHLARAHADDYRRILLFNLVLCGAAAGMGAAMVAGFSGMILRVYGADFVQAAPVLSVLMLSVLAEALMWPLYQTLLSRRYVWLALFATQLPRDLIIAWLGVHLAAAEGALGVAWAHAAGWGWALMGCGLLVALLRQQANRVS